MSMTKGISLNIGLNSVDPKHYGGWDGQLAGCENDANDMADIGATANFDVKKLLTKDATVDNLKLAYIVQLRHWSLTIISSSPTPDTVAN